MKWYKHDSNANADAKVRKLRARYGMAGYGLYWYCLELIAANVDKHNLTFELEHDAELISIDTGIHVDEVQEMMLFMVKLGLFERSSDGIITCLKMRSRTDEYTLKLIRSDNKTPDKLRINSGQTPDSSRIKSDLIEENRIEENRKTSPNRKRFSPPTVDEVRDYINEKKYSVDPERFVAFYESKGWVVGKAKMKCWKSALSNWNSRNNSQPTNGGPAGGGYEL